MEIALNEIRDLHAKANAAGQQEIQEQLRDLQTELYTDWEVLFGMAMGVSPTLQLN
jgi:demethylsterigmatocystin 6-O-methyltransferase